MGFTIAFYSHDLALTLLSRRCMHLYFCAGLVLLRILMYLIMERELTCLKYIKIVIYVNMEMN